MEPVARLLETSMALMEERVRRKQEESAAIISEKMARVIVQSSPTLASPTSITVMVGETPAELFLPPRCAVKREFASRSSGTIVDLAAKQEATLSLLKADQSLLRQALRKEPSLRSLVGAPPSLSEVLFFDDDDDEEEEEHSV